MRNELLRIYMNDQLALGYGWRELARRAQRNNEGTELGRVLAGVANGIAEDVALFETMLRRLGFPRSPVKPPLAIAAERIARLKLNGRLRSYSPLSRFLELDVLAMGLAGKKILWSTLRDSAGLAKRLPDIDFEHLIQRAEAQRAEVEPFRREAAQRAFVVPPGDPDRAGESGAA
jgi:hypothetical protein